MTNEIIVSASFILLYNIVFVNLAFVLGISFFTLFNRQLRIKSFDFFELTKYTFTGVLGIVTIFSLTLTKGLSISFLFFYLLLFYYILRLRKSDFEQYKLAHVESKPKFSFFIGLALLSSVTLLYTLLCFYTNYYFDTNRYYTAFSDFYYYAFNGCKMSLYGIEGVDFNLSITNAASYRTPYHYADLWLLGFFNATNFGRMPLIHLYLFVFTPIMLSIASLALYSVYSFFKTKQKIFDYIIGLLLVLYIFPVQSAIYSGQNILTMPKLYAALIIVCISFIYFLQKEKIKGLIVLFVLPILNVISLPPILFFMSLLGGYWFYKKEWNLLKLIGVMSFLFVSLFLGFYKIFGTAQKKLDLSNLSFKLYFNSFVKTFLKGSLQMVFMLMFCLLLFFIYRKKLLPIISNHLFAFGALVTLIITSYLCSYILWFNFDAFQIRNFPGTIIATVIFIAFIAIVVSELEIKMQPSKIVKSGLLIFFTFSLYYSVKVVRTTADGFVSKTFLEEFDKNIKDGYKFGYVYNSAKEKVSPWINTHNLLLFNLQFPGLTNKNLSKVSLNTIINDIDIDKQKLVKKDFVKQSEFKQFVDSFPIKNLNLYDYQFEFCLTRKLDFLVLEKQAKVSEKLTSYIKKEILDSLSGNRVIFLKY